MAVLPHHGGGRPSYFRECWKYPDAAPGRPAGDEADLLFFPMTDWHTRIQRTQHLRARSRVSGIAAFTSIRISDGSSTSRTV
ncbi:MAG: hypothetical protein IPM24_19885 [Bryobacterales bacterium]|nr:hypothetical protein [Bryobacterales bacterium]